MRSLFEFFGLNFLNFVGRGNLDDSIGGIEEFSNYSTYVTFDSKEEVYYLKDRHIGFALQSDPFVSLEPTKEYDLEQFLLKEFPHKEVHLSFLLISSYKVDEMLHEWTENRHNNSCPMLRKLSSNRAEFFKKNAISFAKNDVIPREYKLIISITASEDLKEDLFEFKEKLYMKLKGINMHPYVLHPQELIKYTREIITPDLKTSGSSPYDPFDYINRQIISRGKLEIKEKEIVYDDKSSLRFYKVARFPNYLILNNMIDLIGETDNTGNSLPGRIFFAFTMTPIYKNQKLDIISRGMGIIESVSKGHGRLTNLDEEAQEWEKIIRGLNDGARLFSTSLIFAVSSPEESKKTAYNNLESIFNKKSWSIEVLTGLQMPALLAMMPMYAYFYYKDLEKFKFTSVRSTAELIGMLPIIGEWKGGGKPGMLLLARRGQLMHWNPYERPPGNPNFNICIFGPSGSGKSVFLQELATSMIALGKRVFILDIGQSFKNICCLLGGDMIQLGTTDICINPFSKIKEATSGTTESEDVSNLKTAAINIIACMCSAETAYQRAILEKALDILFSSKDKSISITSIADIMGGFEETEAKKLSATLYPFTDRGRYGKYFNRDSNITFKKSLTVFELEEVKQDEFLLGVVLQTIAMEIYTQFLIGDRKTHFMLIIDEAWKTLGFTAEFIDELVRTVRKYGGSIVTCVQNYGDFMGSDVRKSIYANSTWKIILQQTGQGIKVMDDPENQKEFGHVMGLIKSVRTLKGKFSEALIKAEGISIVARLALDPYSGTLFSTESEDFAYISDKLSEGYSIDVAADMLVAKKHKE